MWDLPGPGLEPVSPALAGGFLTAAPPGKSVWAEQPEYPHAQYKALWVTLDKGQVRGREPVRPATSSSAWDS